jgi:hypothetical protein
LELWWLAVCEFGDGGFVGWRGRGIWLLVELVLALIWVWLRSFLIFVGYFFGFDNWCIVGWRYFIYLFLLFLYIIFLFHLLSVVVIIIIIFLFAILFWFVFIVFLLFFEGVVIFLFEVYCSSVVFLFFWLFVNGGGIFFAIFLLFFIVIARICLHWSTRYMDNCYFESSSCF